ncbi:MAG: hypothetical protein JRH20_07720 [Deltaproteobacteria bacterium]|nr:hypothetical protein [Deltaproteobacteria bacterium]
MGAIAELKQVVIRTLLQQEDFLLVVVDPSCAQVRLPDFLVEAGQPVGLNIGFEMAVPIPDLTLDDEGIQGTLSFSRTPFFSFIPWDAVLQVSASEEHLVWVLPPTGQDDESSEEQSDDRPKLRLV